MNSLYNRILLKEFIPRSPATAGRSGKNLFQPIMTTNFIIFISILIGYLIGSISPAFILGKVLRGIDIRKFGTKNAGTKNVKKVLGLWPSVICAIFDLSKGLLAMLIAQKFGATELIIYATGYTAVLGHIFPFYLKFRGGEGSATGVAILIFLIVKSIINHWFPFEILIPLSIVALGILFITKSDETIGIFALPMFIILLLFKSLINPTIVFIAIICAQLFIVTLYNIKKFQIKFFEKSKEQMLHWRTILRPLAVLFPIATFYIDKNIILYIVGILASFFIILDLIRLLSSKLNIFLFEKATKVFKLKEKSQFSSMTFFLTAVFIVILVFPQPIAIMSILFMIFGDLAAKFFGVEYGKIKFVSKTLEGSIAYFIFSFAIGYIFSIFAPISLWLLAIGALTASFVEVLSIFGIDDNFTVAIISASVMLGFQVFI